MGILFPSNLQEAAYSAFRIWMSLGFVIGFALGEIKSIQARIWIFLAILLVSFSLYTALEFFTSKYGAKYCKDMSVHEKVKVLVA